MQQQKNASVASLTPDSFLVRIHARLPGDASKINQISLFPDIGIGTD